MKIAESFPRPLSVRRILLIQLGDIGDVVWSLPTLQAIRKAYPEASVAVLLRGGSGSLLTADVSPPEIFEVRKEKQGGFPGNLAAAIHLIRELRRKRFDLVFDLRGDERGGYMAFLTGAPFRAAQHYEHLSWLRNGMFTHLVTPPASGGPASGAAEQSLRILRAFGIKIENDVPGINLSREVADQALRILVSEGVLPPNRGIPADEGAMQSGPAGKKGNGWVTLNPFSRWSYKEWQAEKWGRIIDWMWREFAVATVIVGSPAERDRAASLARTCSGRVHNLAGKTTLAELAGVLRLSRLHIGVDSAAPHIAAAAGTPTVTLYGPSDWRYWAPRGDRHRVVVPDMDCVPCRQKGCEGSGVSRCLDSLDETRVQAVLRDALRP